MECDLRFRSYDGTLLEGTYCGDHRKSDSVAVLVHGITSSRDEFGLFAGLAEHLSGEGMPSIRFDYRCHGRNARPIEEMTLCGVIKRYRSRGTGRSSQVERVASMCGRHEFWWWSLGLLGVSDQSAAKRGRDAGARH